VGDRLICASCGHLGQDGERGDACARCGSDTTVPVGRRRVVASSGPVSAPPPALYQPPDNDVVRAALQQVVAALPGGGEVRPGQDQMALAVADAIDAHRHLIVQAGTGTGKSIGYLVPALLSGSKVVVATATKALQDQLATKDLPFLQQHLGQPFEFAVMKGRSNYLCLQRAREVAGSDDGQLALDDADGESVAGDALGALGRQVMQLLKWGAESETGDRSELSFEPSPRAWAQVSVNAMECPGATRCPVGEACFAERARDRAELADVVVANTHLYGAHLASGGNVLPEHDVVIFDEAHELEDVASSSLGLELGGGRFRALARNARSLLQPAEMGVLEDLEAAGTLWESGLAPHHGRRLPDGLGDDLASIATLAAERVAKATAAIRTSDGDDARRARALQAAGHLGGDLAFIQGLPSSYVTWVEGPAHSPYLKTSPVDVGPLLNEKLWGEITAVLSSATIPPGLASRVGLDRPRPRGESDGDVDVAIVEEGHYTQLDVGSPFDYEHQALLYCAAHLPDPRAATYEAAMHEELESLMRAAGGRTLALFTSWRAMQAAAAAISPNVPFRVLTQSDLPKPALLDAFSRDEESCLFATMGFWQGVDVPGRALSLVTIDRLPFPRPDEPLMQARRELARSAAFRVVDLPRAATMLAQGSGRLIRSSTDFGVVAVFDPRLAKANYRWDLVRALPPMKRTKERAEVEAFLTAHLAGAAVTQ
jgi:ATP-dependent DNA helicase DinG